MSYFTERNGMRNPIERTSTISIEMYSMLFDCCEKYFENIAWKFPAMCPDGNGCCGMDYQRFGNAMKFEIPMLYRSRYGIVANPQNSSYHEEYDQYALLDLIEFTAQNVKDISSRWWHSFHRHDDLSFAETREIAQQYKAEINNIFEKTGLLYTLTDGGIVERVIEQDILTQDVFVSISHISEEGTKELLIEAIALFKNPRPENRKLAVEKIWDAFERLKTYYTSMDKRDSASKIVNDIGNGNGDFIRLIDEEFKGLTTIGNSYRIRHHETNKIDLSDDRHYDYLFNRCLSLMALAIQYLQ